MPQGVYSVVLHTGLSVQAESSGVLGLLQNVSWCVKGSQWKEHLLNWKEHLLSIDQDIGITQNPVMLCSNYQFNDSYCYLNTKACLAVMLQASLHNGEGN